MAVERNVFGTKNFANVVLEDNKVDFTEGMTIPDFNTSEEVRDRWKSAFVGDVLFPGASYNVQTHLETEGFFSVKVYPLGANLCLLEEIEERII